MKDRNSEWRLDHLLSAAGEPAPSVVEEFPYCVAAILIYAAVLGMVSLLIVQLRLPDSLLYFFLIPCVLSAFFFKRRVYLSMQVLLTGAAVWVTSRVSSSFQTSLINIAALGMNAILITEIIYALVTARERARKELRESEERYRGFFEHAINGFALHDIVLDDDGNPIDYVFKEVNPAFEKLTGLKADDILGQRVTEVLPGIEETTFIETYGRVVLTGEPTRFEQYSVPLDRHYNIAAYSPCRGQFVTLFTDVTDRVRAKEELQESLAHLTTLVENLQMGVLVEDEARVVIHVNQAFSDLFGIEAPHVIIGADCAAAAEASKSLFIKPKAFLRGIEECLADRETVIGEELTLVDGRTLERDYIPILIDEEQRGHLWLYRDITERKQAEEELHRRDAILEAVSFAAEQFLREASWEESIQGVLERLGRAAEASRVYVFENRVTEDSPLLTSQRYEWVAPGIASQIDNPELQNFPLQASGFARWEERLNKGQLIHGHVREFPAGEYEVLSAQDILSIVVVPIFVGQAWWGFIGFDECVTEREWSAVEMEALKAAASTLGAAIQRQRVEEALQASLREKEVLLQEIHHRVKNNLQVISSLLRFQSRHTADEQARAVLTESRHRVRSMTLVHEKLYQSSNLTDIDFEEYLRSLTTHLLRLYRGYAGDITLDIEATDVMLSLDAAIPCGLIASELVSNALKHAFPPGTGGEIHIALRSEDEHRSLIIADNGIGFPGDVDVEQTGSLGLQLVDMLVRQLRGAITLHRENGTTFEITFPKDGP